MTWIRRNVSGIVLNGGLSRRMGSDKCGLVVGGRSLIERTLDVLAKLFDEILVVGRPIPDAIAGSPVSRHASRVTRHVPDAIPGSGPLAGIYTGLLAMTRPLGFFVACDMPCLDPEVIRRQIDVARASDADVVVPCWEDRRVQVCTPYVEPLHALYSQDCLPAARRQIESGDFRIRGFFRHVKVLFWDVRAEGISTKPFTNINTKSDLAALLGPSAQRRTD